MDIQQVYAAASIIDSMYYRYNHTNWLHRQIRKRIIINIHIKLNVPLDEAQDLYDFALENKIPRVWYALIERSEIIDFPSRELIPEAVRFISEDSLKEIIAERLRLDEIEGLEDSED